MTQFSLLLALVFTCTQAFAVPLERSFSEGYLGEKTQPIYAGPWRPVSHHDPYFGRYSLDDEQFFNGYFYNYIWEGAPDWSRFFSEEMMGASTCPHNILSQNFDEIRYGFRLIALSYLLEILDGERHEMALLKKADTCTFDLQEILKTCRPKTDDMKTFIQNLTTQKPYSAPIIDKSHNFATYQKTWLQKINTKDATLGGIRLKVQCRSENTSCVNMPAEKAVAMMGRSCGEDRKLFQEICSEEDQLYGISTSPMSTHLLSTSNLMNLINAEGMAMGCLRRFGQMMASKERHYPVLNGLQPIVYSQLRTNYGERYLLGRAFVFGALKEFTQKGLKNIFEPQVAKVEEKPVEKPIEVAKTPVVAEKPVVVEVKPVVPEKKPAKTPEVPLEVKTAFLQAAEVRLSQNLERVDVDMLKFRYDYVFSMAELQLLSESLKDYVARGALEEMRSWDKLGEKEAPMPLTFLKYLIDSENHQGLYNVVGVLGDKFWVMNDIDQAKQLNSEYVELRNDASTGNTWQLYILKAEI
jgi:hypothetical protein